MPDKGQADHHGKVLISDDDEFFRVALMSVLRDRIRFAEVIETDSFEAALDQLVDAGPVEMGLFDLNMVGMENWLDLSALRAEYPEMMLVVVSASRRREDILRALEIGAHGFINKGLGVYELSRAIDLIRNGQVYVPPFLPDNPTGDLLLNFAMDAALAKPGQAATSGAGPAIADGCDGSAGNDIRLRLSPRQSEIVDLLIAGHSNKSMARVLNLSEGTIKFHMSAVMRLFGVTSRVEAATRAMTALGR